MIVSISVKPASASGARQDRPDWSQKLHDFHGEAWTSIPSSAPRTRCLAWRAGVNAWLSPCAHGAISLMRGREGNGGGGVFLLTALFYRSTGDPHVQAISRRARGRRSRRRGSRSGDRGAPGRHDVPGRRTFLASLHTIRTVASTVPANGDVDPYGLAVVPSDVGSLHAGDYLSATSTPSPTTRGRARRSSRSPRPARGRCSPRSAQARCPAAVPEASASRPR